MVAMVSLSIFTGKKIYSVSKLLFYTNFIFCCLYQPSSFHGCVTHQMSHADECMLPTVIEKYMLKKNYKQAVVT